MVISTALKSRGLVIARITKHANSIAPAQAVVVKRLDPDRPVELATESSIARFDLRTSFHPRLSARLKGEVTGLILPSQISERTFVRFPLVTIDGETARDFDDAVYAEAS